MRKRKLITEEEREQAKAIGRRIVQARNDAGGMTQQQLAELLGVSARSMQSYESGEIVPWRFMEELERILSKPSGWFAYGDPPKTKAVSNAEVIALLREVLHASKESISLSKQILAELRTR